MKVKELIEKLQLCDENMNVYAGYSGDNLLNDSDSIVDIIQVEFSKVETNNGVYLRIGG